MSWEAADAKALSLYIDEAERLGLWLHCRYQDLWFSPARLREQNAKGQFNWGIVNWMLCDPQEKIDELRRRAKVITEEADKMEQEVKGGRK